MKATILFTSIMSLLMASSFAQDRTTVNATSSEISDNLDLRAVASIFGDSENLEDFEQRLNDPKAQISNLDLNNDDRVDYLRVIESVEGRTHLIVVQSVLGRDTFQDVATIEVEKDRNNRVQVQVVGDVYMYGANYIYEPVYVHTPIIYTHFWVSSYRPYCSTWYWDYYPTYYTFWNPCPIFRYRHNIGLWINVNHQYNYVNNRRCQVAYTNYYGRRGNGYERQYPNRSFSHRNSGYTNRYDLDRTRANSRRDVAFNNNRSGGRTEANSRDNRSNGRNNASTRNDGSTRSADNGNVRETRSNNGRNENRSSSETSRNRDSRSDGQRSESVRTPENTPVRGTRNNAGSNENRSNSESRTNRDTRNDNQRSESVRTSENRPSRSTETRSNETNGSRQSGRQESQSRGSSAESSRSSGNGGQSGGSRGSGGGRRS